MNMKSEAALQCIDEGQWNLLEHYDMLVNVIDLNSYEIVRANNYSKNILGDVTGKICWHAFHAAQQGPCPFCPKLKLLDKNQNPQGTWIWEMQSKRNGCWYEMIDKAFYWVDGRLVKLQIARDITKRKRAGDALRRCKSELESCFLSCIRKIETTRVSLARKSKEHRMALSHVEEKALELEAVNVAMQVLLDKYRQQENELEEKIVSNLKKIIFPLMDILERYLHEKQEIVCLGLIKEKLLKLSSSFSKKLSSDLLNLSSREIQVAELIKQGKTTKEIAYFLHLSSSTVECFRDRLREKLGIKNKKVNLRTFLISNFK